MFNKKLIYKFIIINSICGACGILSTVNASCHKYSWRTEIFPYIGIDYKISYTQGLDYWKKILPTNKTYQHASLFAGVKFHDLLSGEFGYTQSGKLSKNSNISGTFMWNRVAPNGTSQNIKLSYNSWHMDLNLQYPSENFALLWTVGAASSRAKVLANNLGAAGNNLIKNIIGKSKIIPRVGMGFQFTRGMFGIRSRLIIENNSRLRLNSPGYNLVFPGITNKAFKNTYLWNLGMFLNL